MKSLLSLYCRWLGNALRGYTVIPSEDCATPKKVVGLVLGYNLKQGRPDSTIYFGPNIYRVPCFDINPSKG